MTSRAAPPAGQVRSRCYDPPPGGEVVGAIVGAGVGAFVGAIVGAGREAPARERADRDGRSSAAARCLLRATLPPDRRRGRVRGDPGGRVAGTDYSDAIARACAHRDPRLAFTFLDLGRRSRAVGYNRAFEVSRGELIVFFGDDYLAPRTLVEAHLAHHARHPEESAVGIGSAILTGPLRRSHFAVWLEETGELYGIPFRDDMSEVPESFLYVGNASVKRPFLERVGTFDERFRYHSWDDYELGLRLRAAGMRAVYVPCAKAEHSHDLSLAERCRVMEQSGRNARAFERKYPGRHGWQRRLRTPPWRQDLKALHWRSLHALTGSEDALVRYYRSRLRSAFARGYRSAGPGAGPAE